MSLILVIESAEKWFQKEYVNDIFKKLEWGEIEKINVVNNNNCDYNTIYIYYKSWNHHKSHARYARDDLVRYEKTIKLYYSKNLYWLVKVSHRQPIIRPEYPYYEVV